MTKSLGDGSGSDLITLSDQSGALINTRTTCAHESSAIFAGIIDEEDNDEHVTGQTSNESENSLNQCDMTEWMEQIIFLESLIIKIIV